MRKQRKGRGLEKGKRNANIYRTIKNNKKARERGK